MHRKKIMRKAHAQPLNDDRLFRSAISLHVAPQEVGWESSDSLEDLLRSRSAGEWAIHFAGIEMQYAISGLSVVDFSNNLIEPYLLGGSLPGNYQGQHRVLWNPFFHKVAMCYALKDSELSEPGPATRDGIRDAVKVQSMVAERCYSAMKSKEPLAMMQLLGEISERNDLRNVANLIADLWLSDWELEAGISYHLLDSEVQSQIGMSIRELSLFPYMIAGHALDTYNKKQGNPLRVLMPSTKLPNRFGEIAPAFVDRFCGDINQVRDLCQSSIGDDFFECPHYKPIARYPMLKSSSDESDLFSLSITSLAQSCLLYPATLTGSQDKSTVRSAFGKVVSAYVDRLVKQALDFDWRFLDTDLHWANSTSEKCEAYAIVDQLIVAIETKTVLLDNLQYRYRLRSSAEVAKWWQKHAYLNKAVDQLVSTAKIVRQSMPRLRDKKKMLLPIIVVWETFPHMPGSFRSHVPDALRISEIEPLCLDPLIISVDELQWLRQYNSSQVLKAIWRKQSDPDMAFASLPQLLFHLSPQLELGSGHYEQSDVAENLRREASRIFGLTDD